MKVPETALQEMLRLPSTLVLHDALLLPWQFGRIPVAHPAVHKRIEPEGEVLRAGIAFFPAQPKGAYKS
jgi:hypothetical protein